MTMTLTIPRRLTRDVADLTEASAVYCAARELSGAGASTFAEGTVTRGGEFVARISYNGRVWRSPEWTPGERPLQEASEPSFEPTA